MLVVSLHRMKKLFFLVLHKLGVTRIAAWWNRRRVVILCFHGVTERARRSVNDPSGLHIRGARFDAQLNYLQAHYTVISLTEFLRAVQSNGRLPEKSVVLTFDDGFRNFLTSAAPRLTARNMPVSLFVITERIRSQSTSNTTDWSEPDDETYLSWEEVKLLQKQGVEFGSHTRTHRKLAKLSPAEAREELCGSLETLARHLSQDRFPLAYPYGSYSETVINASRELGYKCALTTDAGTNERSADLFLLRRNLIGDDDVEALFAARVSGLTALLAQIFVPWRRGTKRAKASHAVNSYADA